MYENASGEARLLVRLGLRGDGRSEVKQKTSKRLRVRVIFASSEVRLPARLPASRGGQHRASTRIVRSALQTKEIVLKANP